MSSEEKFYVEGKNGRPLMIAWSLANFSGTPSECDFVFQGNVSKWAKQNPTSPIPSRAALSPLERIVHPHAGTFRYSERAAEFYKMSHETVAVPGADLYASVNHMLMNGRQHAHYHPVFNSVYPDAPLRIMILYPASNTSPKYTDGLTVRLFELDRGLVDHERKTVVGVPQTPQYVAHFPPGHIAMLIFKGNNVHDVEGNGIITSIHPQDVGIANIGDTYDANTIGWEGDKCLEEQVNVPIRTAGQVANPSYTSLQDVFVRHAHIARSMLDKLVSAPIAAGTVDEEFEAEKDKLRVYDPVNPFTPNALKNMRRKLRAVISEGSPLPKPWSSPGDEDCAAMQARF